MLCCSGKKNPSPLCCYPSDLARVGILLSFPCSRGSGGASSFHTPAAAEGGNRGKPRRIPAWREQENTTKKSLGNSRTRPLAVQYGNAMPLYSTMKAEEGYTSSGNTPLHRMPEMSQTGCQEPPRPPPAARLSPAHVAVPPPSRGEGLPCWVGMPGTSSSRAAWAVTRSRSRWVAGTFVFPALSPVPIQSLNKSAVWRVCSTLIREAVGAVACVCTGERFYICCLKVKDNATVW